MSMSWSSSHQYGPVKERERALSPSSSLPPSLNPGTLTLYAQPSAALWSQLQHPRGLLTTQQWIMHEHEAAVFATEGERERARPLSVKCGRQRKGMNARTWIFAGRGRRKEKEGEEEQSESRKSEALIASPNLPSFPTHLPLTVHLHSLPSEDFCRGSFRLQIELRN